MIARFAEQLGSFSALPLSSNLSIPDSANHEHCWTDRNDLMQQLVLDTDLYTVNSTPVPDPAVRTVRVKARRSVTATAATPVISIANPPTP